MECSKKMNILKVRPLHLTAESIRNVRRKPKVSRRLFSLQLFQEVTVIQSHRTFKNLVEELQENESTNSYMQTFQRVRGSQGKYS